MGIGKGNSRTFLRTEGIALIVVEDELLLKGKAGIQGQGSGPEIAGYDLVARGIDLEEGEIELVAHRFEHVVFCLEDDPVRPGRRMLAAQVKRLFIGAV